MKDWGTRTLLEASGREAGVSSWVFLSGLQESRYNSLNYFFQTQGKATESQRGFSAKLGQKCKVSPSELCRCFFLSSNGTETFYFSSSSGIRNLKRSENVNFKRINQIFKT